MILLVLLCYRLCLETRVEFVNYTMAIGYWFLRLFELIVFPFLAYINLHFDPMQFCLNTLNSELTFCSAIRIFHQNQQLTWWDQFCVAFFLKLKLLVNLKDQITSGGQEFESSWVHLLWFVVVHTDWRV